ncbi:hypothetical protein PV328_011344 [Microctonus aethiopoides]|uniref:Peptidase M12B domain-containing protein n=1 Tax=Microctonus aethiopoides TaxID=144406 RepID=A0AA39C485_9HYME|nr:hypothetical protein PV328_011344 [Microctonus aethiopoides]
MTSNNITTDGISRKLRNIHEQDFQILTLKLKINGKSKIINLTPTSQLLANEHLPVWISSKRGDKLRKLHDIMANDVGKFTMYHDYCTKSAVIHFHKRGELDGIVDIKYKIEGLPIDKLHEEHVISSGIFDVLKIKKYFRKHSKKTVCTPEFQADESLKLEIYPELLVAISHDMYQAIEKKSVLPHGVKTISHVLTVYNIVDMLFRFVKSAEISLNIAGIVIEGNEDHWGFLSEAYSGPNIDSKKLHRLISKYFRKMDNVYIRRHSYDYVAYNTRKQLWSSKYTPILGTATFSGFRPMFLNHELYFRKNLAVIDSNSYDHYPVIAHELAHIFNAEHDRSVNWFFTRLCDRSIMAAMDCFSKYSLKWTAPVEKNFQKFFNSPAHCILRNEPQSLHPPNPRRILTGLQQCQCYGYDFYVQSDNECSDNLACMNKEWEFEMDLPYTMDGTPCEHDSENVCWKEQCVKSMEKGHISNTKKRNHVISSVNHDEFI